jgi:hypothetical protein
MNIRLKGQSPVHPGEEPDKKPFPGYENRLVFLK